ncbi:hypothetical protein N5D48_15090 [Pseudomonas sp. GD03858]|uniref:ATP-binding cassette domain-containing protein n=1 Tax=unclassified Pseudomonas TaxID=196821 RepID=UPI00244CB252|nr:MULTISPECIES: hypothetical protein [unclassified Pseudomonas]MDH0647839.1 hypothetical protein [Pseudomonas sp. GD03867]MDH0663735.1 hypothetical protein [Pseudomonas sp. GD03858]
MIYRDWRFLSALGLTILQQVLLALSTYYIAQAGLTLETGNVKAILLYVSLFFFLALLAYVASSIATLFSTRASNEAWKNYSNTTLIKATEDLQYASEKNKKSVAQWLGGEASSTIAYACGFYLGLVSVSLNVIFTLLVFYISVGWQITLAMTASLALSLGLVMILRKQIEKSAGQMQSQKLSALLSIELAWNSAMFGSRNMRDEGFHGLNDKVNSYFGTVNKYVLLEQIIACAPIILSTVVIIVALQCYDIFTLAVAGTIVAILPRSLQVFGNVHSLSIYLSQFYLVRTKIRNLDEFSSKLDINLALYSSSLRGVTIRDASTRDKIEPDEFISQLQGHRISSGRYTVTGLNGSGKSSLLKIIKGSIDDALLITPETSFMNLDGGLSTGQTKIRELEKVLSLSPPVLMLDEWDANLDEDNSRKIDQVLELASSQVVVIEVRHLGKRMDAIAT